MIRSRRSVAAFILFYFISMSANAGDQSAVLSKTGRPTAEGLVNDCAASEKAPLDANANWRTVSCSTFIDGFMSGLGLLDLLKSQGSMPNYKPLYCLTAGNPVDDYISVFRAYVLKHPETRDQEATFVLAMSLVDAFPCRD
jgi:hypothetical protein